jgi:hypothetical protein
MASTTVNTATVSVQETFALSLTDRAVDKVKDFAAKMPDAADKPCASSSRPAAAPASSTASRSTTRRRPTTSSPSAASASSSTRRAP